MAWSYGFAAQAGAVHEDGVCQDSCIADTVETPDGHVLVAAISDGAGSSALGSIGSSIACVAFLEHAKNLLRTSDISKFTNSQIKDLFQYVVHAIKERADKDGEKLEEYSATLVGALVGPKNALFMQVGDGAATYREDDDFVVPIWPEQGEFVNSTYFLTRKDARKHLLVRRVNEHINEVVLFTDGLQYMLLDFKEKEPHQPFFQTVVCKLNEEQPGFSESFSAWLSVLLASPQVISRSDDDTSIVVARRCPA